VATAAVYGRLSPAADVRPIGPIREALVSGDLEALGGGLFNRLQPVAEAFEPGLRRVREALDRLCPTPLVGSLMSGSGSAYFGLARDPDAARAAARQLESLGLGRVRVVTCGP